MALFVARPSRGSWTFFVLVALAALTARGWARYERTVVRRDAPLAERAQDLGACLFGRDAAWILAGDASDVWEDRFSQWLRAAVSVPQESAWPGRCVPIADGLLDKLQRSSGAPLALTTAARDTRDRLREVSAPRATLRRVEVADSESLARPLAALFAGVRNLSLGTRAGWRPTPAHLSRYASPTMPRLLRLRPIPPEIDRVTLAQGTSVVAFLSRDGRAHQLTLTPRALRDASLASAVPVGSPRESVMRAESDQGPAWLVLGGGAYPMPADFTYVGDPARFTWDAALTDRHLAVAALDQGTARLFVTPRDPQAVWAPPLTVGDPQRELAVTVAADGDGWRVTTLHAEGSDATLQQRVVRRAPEAPNALTVDPPERLLRESVPAFGLRVLTCASGEQRYFAVANTTHVTVYRVAGSSARSARVEATWPQGYALALSCDATRALLSASPTLSRNGHWLFTFQGAASGIALEAPAEGPGAVVRAMALTRDAVVAFVSTEGALRSFRYTTREGLGVSAWEVGGLVALSYTADGYERTFTQLDVSAEGDHLALHLRGQYGLRPPRTPQEAQARAARVPAEPRPEAYATLLGSDDGGASFWSP
jgi:hypothetical protein